MVVAMLVLGVCGLRQNLSVLGLCRNPDLDDRIVDCSIASMAAVHAEDVRAFFLFVGDFNGHHQVWLGSTTTKGHGVASLTSQMCQVAISWLSNKQTGKRLSAVK